MIKKLLLALVALLVLTSCGPTKPAETQTSTPTQSAEETKTDPVVSDVAINVYTRDATSGTREAFEGGVGLKKGELTVSAVETSGNGDIAQKTGADAAGIGYVSLTTDFEGNNLKKVNFEGVEATEPNVLDHSYKLSRPFSYVTRSADDYSNEATKKAVTAFLDFLNNSTEGLEAVEGAGGIVDKSKAKAWSELAGAHGELDASVTLRTAGSTSVEKTLKAALEAFEAETGVKFVMAHTGSGDGWIRVLGDEKDTANGADLGFASRNFKTDGTEELGLAMETGYYCLDAVVVVVSKDNSSAPTNLTAAQIVSIFKGEVKNWKDVK